MSDNHDADFIEYVVKQLVENPEGVKVERTVDEMGVLIQLTVDRNDMGRVIGKEGRTAKALRTLLRVLGAKNNARVNLKIMEPEGGEVRIGDDDSSERRTGHDEDEHDADDRKPSEDTPATEEPAEIVEEQPAATPAEDSDQVTEVL